MLRYLGPSTRPCALALAFAASAVLAACARSENADAGAEGDEGAFAGAVEIDGSSTVFPIAEAMAEEFQLANPDTRITVGFSGTGGGFERFCGGETDISMASRPITQEEIDLCGQNTVEYVALPVAWDGLSVVVNPANDFVECLTLEELRRIWEPNSSVSMWSDVRAGFPEEDINLYGAGTDSGTFDYFTEAVMGEAGASRADYQASEDDNVLVQGVSGDQSSLGYFGFAYYVQSSDQLKLVGVDDGSGCVSPSDATIADESYPLARPLFIYVKRAALGRPETQRFVRFFMENAADLVPSTGYHPLDTQQYAENLGLLGDAAAPGETARD